VLGRGVVGEMKGGGREEVEEECGLLFEECVLLLVVL
jgi:hypothetical protein